MTTDSSADKAVAEISAEPVIAASINKSRIRWGEALIKSWLGLCAFISIVTTAAIVILLLRETSTFFK